MNRILLEKKPRVETPHQSLVRGVPPSPHGLVQSQEFSDQRRPLPNTRGIPMTPPQKPPVSMHVRLALLATLPVIALWFFPFHFPVRFAPRLQSQPHLYVALVLATIAAGYLVALLVAIPFGLALRHWWKQHRQYQRWVHHQCLQCSYDLRTHLAAKISPNCPECGTPISPPIP
jgi:hypothetical protein